MAQIKIYGLKTAFAARRIAISDAIHGAVVEHLSLPPEKRFHRFLGLETEDFVFPADRSENYLILEISMFQGRTVATKKALILGLFARLGALGFAASDVEITIFETPRHNWGIRGQTGDELGLNYPVEV